MKRILRIFPRKTNATPGDEQVRVGQMPSLFDEADYHLLQLCEIFWNRKTH